MYLVFSLVSIAVAFSLASRSASALSFTGNLNPFASKPAPRSQLTSIDAGAFAGNVDTYSNVRPAVQQPNIKQANAASVLRPISRQASTNPDDGARSKWPNMRFMRTFLRNGQATAASNSPGRQLNGYNQFNEGANQFNPKYILGFNPTTAEQSKQLAKLPTAEQHKQTLNENAGDPAIGLIDWNQIVARLNQATGYRNAQLNETAMRAKHADLYAPSDSKKEEDEKESNNGLYNYFAQFFSNSDNETIQAEKEKQLAKQKPISDKKPPPSIDNASDLFYFDENLLAKKQIEVLICDKTMAIIEVRRNRFKANRTVVNCVLFDLEKRGKVSVVCSSCYEVHSRLS